MSKLINLTGKRFGRWIVISKSKSENGKLYWLCKCDCGTTSIVDGDTLRRGTSTGCKKCRHIWSKHYLSGNPLYYVWNGIKQRCSNLNASEYENYGGRGISICDEWKNDFKSFYDWAILNGYQRGLSIDRINANGNYEPSNCRWTTMKVQQSNKRTNTIILFSGKSKTLQQWAEYLGVKPNTLCGRIKRYGIERAMTVSSRKGDESL